MREFIGSERRLTYRKFEFMTKLECTQKRMFFATEIFKQLFLYLQVFYPKKVTQKYVKNKTSEQSFKNDNQWMQDLNTNYQPVFICRDFRKHYYGSVNKMRKPEAQKTRIANVKNGPSNEYLIVVNLPKNHRINEKGMPYKRRGSIISLGGEGRQLSEFVFPKLVA